MTAIKERPILFSAPMVRAILEGRKTVTRRAMKVQPVLNGKFWQVYGAGWSDGVTSVPAVPGHSLSTKCPYGTPGDRLWVRETWYCDHFEVMRGPYLKPDDLDIGEARGDGTLVYAADGLTPYEADQPVWKPSIHMPRWACRILLEITAVRVERLQDITPNQCIAEGAWPEEDKELGRGQEAVTAFAELWKSTGGDWEANPWVWVVEFKQVTP